MAKRSAYEVARTAGNPHHGWLQQQRRLPSVKLKKAMRSLRRQIAQHEAWIANPYLKFPPDAEVSAVRWHRERKWPGDIARQRELIEILEGVIHERTDEK